jgi:hypothetical protein
MAGTTAYVQAPIERCVESSVMLNKYDSTGVYVDWRLLAVMCTLLIRMVISDLAVTRSWLFVSPVSLFYILAHLVFYILFVFHGFHVSIAAFIEFIRPIALANGSVSISVDASVKRLYCLLSDGQIVGDG